MNNRNTNDESPNMEDFLDRNSVIDPSKPIDDGIVGRRVNLLVAQDLVKKGIRIRPCDTDEKPMRLTCMSECESVSRFWEENPSALVAIPTIDFWVVVLEHPVDKSALELNALTGMELVDVANKCGCIVKTPSLGLHFYFRRLPGVHIWTTRRFIAKRRLRFKGHLPDGGATGYAIAPGCIHPNGETYEIISGGLDALTEAPHPLLLAAAFQEHAIRRINENSYLKSLLSVAEPKAWRSIYAHFDRHTRIWPSEAPSG